MLKVKSRKFSTLPPEESARRPGNLGERGWEMGTVEIGTEHEIATSAAVRATVMGNWEVL